MTVSLQQVILDDAAYYLMHNIIDKQTLINLQQAHDTCIAALYNVHTSVVNDGFDIPEALLYAPIARDWVEYNKYDNRGAIISSKY